MWLEFFIFKLRYNVCTVKGTDLQCSAGRTTHVTTTQKVPCVLPYQPPPFTCTQHLDFHHHRLVLPASEVPGNGIIQWSWFLASSTQHNGFGIYPWCFVLSAVCSFLLLSGIPIHHSLFTLSMGIWVFSSLGLLWAKLLWTFYSSLVPALVNMCAHCI